MKKRNSITLESRIGELYDTPVGHDTLYKVLLQMNLSEKIITNKLVSNCKLKTIASLTKKSLGTGFFDALLTLVNSEKDNVQPGPEEVTPKWWKEAVFYQIYPRSFYDTDGDGIGDLRGIIEKLDYLKDLGVTALWLSPIYDSPNDDNGYDIRDYHKIMTEFGTMEDFDELLEKAHERGIRLIMDLVINHTSDEHRWFQEALKNPDSPYRDYYYFQKDDGSRTVPNNWTSFFSGSAWNYYEDQNLWALHLFSKKQMDLNWENPKLREDVIDMINWWLDKGVDGFRMDVINYISKPEGLPDGDETIGKMMGYPGIEKYYYGPKLHDYLKEIREKAFDPHEAFSVGETPGLGMKMCQLITGEDRKELDMVFSFDHLETPGHVRFDDYQYDLNYYRDYMIDWMEHYGNQCWMSVFYNNHDNPRMVSKINTSKEHEGPLAALLAVMQFTLKGTPFIFQGDEMGLVNYRFTSMDQITDVEAKGFYQELLKEKSEEEAFKIICAGTRENARILLPWNELPADYRIKKNQKIKTEITNIYKQLIQLRQSDLTLVYGDYKTVNKKKDRFVYMRTWKDTEYLIDCNLSAKAQKAHPVTDEYELVYPARIPDKSTLLPYAARIWRRKL